MLVCDLLKSAEFLWGAHCLLTPDFLHHAPSGGGLDRGTAMEGWAHQWWLGIAAVCFPLYLVPGHFHYTPLCTEDITLHL